MVRNRDVLKSYKDVVGSGGSGADDKPEKREQAGEMPETPASEPPPAQSAEKGAPVSGVADLYRRAIKAVEQFHRLAQVGELLNIDELEQITLEMIDSLQKSDNLFLKSLISCRSLGSLAEQSVHVAVVVIKMALNIQGYSARQVFEVSLCAIMHEVGMVRVPPVVLTKKGELSEEELEQIKRHPLHGREILEKVRDRFPFVPDVIVQEHERWDGSGYPYGLKGDEILEYAQFLGIADTFVALISDRHYRDNFIAFKAIQAIIERRNKDFSARVIKYLIDVVSIFPVGSLVRLNDGSVARVIRTHQRFPIRPRVEIVRDAHGHDVEERREIDLSQEPMIYIVSPILDPAAYD